MWFFFFKQKTAYEMRMSDWSSDVCSSDLVADLQRQRQQIGCLLVEHVGRIAGRPGQHAGAGLAAVAPAADRVADCLVHGLGEAAELADVEEDPARVLGGILARDEHHLGLQDAGGADHAATRLDDGLGQRSEEHTSELQSLMRTSYAVFCLKKKNP